MLATITVLVLPPSESCSSRVSFESRYGTCAALAPVERNVKQRLDILLIGPFDLAKQLGIERGGPEHEAAIKRILEAAHAAGKKAAIFCTGGKDAQVRTQQGFDMVSVVSIEGALAQKMQSELDVATSAAEETQVGKAY